MLETSKNIDIICLSFRHYMSELDAEMQKDTKKLVQTTKSILNANVSIKEEFCKEISAFFEFRIKALNWLVGLKKRPYELVDEVIEDFAVPPADPRLSNLYENIFFALRTNKRIADSIISNGSFSQNIIVEHPSPAVPIISFNQFVSSIALNVPNEVAQKIIDWVTSSLYIEFVLLATSIITDEKIKISDEKINELSDIVVDAAHDFSALAVELDVVKPKSRLDQAHASVLDREFIAEQKRLADSGLADFSNALKKYDA